MGTNVLVVCAAALIGITSVAVQIALSSIVRCKDCLAEGILDEGLVDDETEGAVVRPRDQFVRDGKVVARQVIRGEGLVC